MNLPKNKAPSFHAVLQKKKILTFLCALWPGGGYMYLGMMKKGAMLMALFTATSGLTLTVGWKFLGFLLPVIWCYCFFDTFHASRLTESQRKTEDDWCLRAVLRFLREEPWGELEGRGNIIGVILLLLALYTVVYGVLLPFFRWGENFFWVRLTLSVIPTAVVAVLLFMLGKHFLQKEAEKQEGTAEETQEDETSSLPEADETDAQAEASEPGKTPQPEEAPELTELTETEDAQDKTAPEDSVQETAEIPVLDGGTVVEQSEPVFLQERDEALIAQAALAVLEEEEKAL